MNPIVYHIVSGQAWFSGIGLLLLAVIVDGRSANTLPTTMLGKSANLLWLAAVLLMALASVAAAAWVYSFLVGSLAVWLWNSRRSSFGRSGGDSEITAEATSQSVSVSAMVDRRHRWPAALLIASLLVAGAVELPFHFQPTLQPVSEAKMAIIGDSVTAGIGGNETSERWPQILHRLHGLQVQDISHMGETAKSATKRLAKFEVDSPLVIVEIGGNDVLGGTSVSHFDRDLDALLKTVCVDGRQVVMFELPLPPFFHGYGYVQRRLAAKYEVKLLPKSMFLSALSGADSTLDSIHLSQTGHQRMADAVWTVVKSAFQEQL